MSIANQFVDKFLGVVGPSASLQGHWKPFSLNSAIVTVHGYNHCNKLSIYYYCSIATIHITIHFLKYQINFLAIITRPRFSTRTCLRSCTLWWKNYPEWCENVMSAVCNNGYRLNYMRHTISNMLYYPKMIITWALIERGTTKLWPTNPLPSFLQHPLDPLQVEMHAFSQEDPTSVHAVICIRSETKKHKILTYDPPWLINRVGPNAVAAPITTHLPLLVHEQQVGVPLRPLLHRELSLLSSNWKSTFQQQELIHKSWDI